MGDVRDFLTLPEIGEPPRWLSEGDRPCWFTLEGLLQRTQAVVKASS